MLVKRFALLACAGLFLAGCQSGKKPPSNVPTEYLTGTSLDRNAIGVRSQTQFLEVNLNPADSQLRLPEIARVQSFLADYQSRGHGPLILSSPKNAPNPQLAVGATAEVRELAWNAGIEYEQIAGSAYDASGRRAAPIIMAFKTYIAIKPDCPQLSEIDFTNAISNSDLPTLGCAVRTNMAAMIADPADLLGQRPLEEGDILRRLVMLENFREGAATGADRGDDESGAVSTAVN
ncbi:MAG: CpaD family pilus assembly protein [Pseudomonadota bacterium]